jgi:NTE family protein
MPKADLVLEGGGVKGSGLVGAVTALVDRDDPYEFARFAGTSAGAIVASILAAGVSTAELKKIMDDLQFSKFEDLPSSFRFTPRFGAILGLLFRQGMYRGDFLHQWISETLENHNVRTWADLRQDDPNSSLPPDQRYKLVVIVSDVSQGRMLRLPWDYRSELGVDPDTQPVADAVRASASIPFFFRPFVGGGSRQKRVLFTDGGMLSNYPIDIFDRTDGQPPRWATLGVKLSARESADSTWRANKNSFQLALSLLSTMQEAHDRVHIDNPAYSSRTVFVDTSGYKATDFGLSSADKADLFNRGLASGKRFLTVWDWEKWKQGDYAALLNRSSSPTP